MPKAEGPTRSGRAPLTPCTTASPTRRTLTQPAFDHQYVDTPMGVIAAAHGKECTGSFTLNERGAGQGGFRPLLPWTMHLKNFQGARRVGALPPQ